MRSDFSSKTRQPRIHSTKFDEVSCCILLLVYPHGDKCKVYSMTMSLSPIRLRNPNNLKSHVVEFLFELASVFSQMFRWWGC